MVEKAQSVAVVPYQGEWKDLGTWNILNDELKRHTIGNAFLGPVYENTQVINELQNPIFVDGVKDVVLAACPDGILVCAKKKTENLLDFVQILQEELIRAGVLPADYDFEAHKKLVPVQAGDVPVTYADTTPLEEDFGFKPATPLREGLRAFAEWHAGYYGEKDKEGRTI